MGSVRAWYNDNDPLSAAWLRVLVAQGVLPEGDVDDRDIRLVTPDDLRGYTQCHFFAGIGGWAFALQLAGWPSDRPVWTGSCPCQPFSVAGRRKGVSDDRHLWPHWKPLIAECRPAIVLGEQVASAAGRDWLAVVRADLEDLAYAVGAADLCAAGVGAPHIRQRLYWGAGLADARGRGRQQVGRRASRDEAADGRAGRDGRGADGDHLAAGDGEDGGGAGLADADGGESRDRQLQRGGRHLQQPEDAPALRGLADTERGGRLDGRGPGEERAAGAPGDPAPERGDLLSEAARLRDAGPADPGRVAESDGPERPARLAQRVGAGPGSERAAQPGLPGGGLGDADRARVRDPRREPDAGTPGGAASAGPERERLRPDARDAGGLAGVAGDGDRLADDRREGCGEVGAESRGRREGSGAPGLEQRPAHGGPGHDPASGRLGVADGVGPAQVGQGDAVVRGERPTFWGRQLVVARAGAAGGTRDGDPAAGSGGDGPRDARAPGLADPDGAGRDRLGAPRLHGRRPGAGGDAGVEAEGDADRSSGDDADRRGPAGLAVGDALRTGLEGHAGDGDDRDEPGRVATLAPRPAAPAGGAGGAAPGRLADADGLQPELPAGPGPGSRTEGSAGPHDQPAGPGAARGTVSGLELPPGLGRERREGRPGGRGDDHRPAAEWREGHDGSLRADQVRPVDWRECDWLPCRDGRVRPVEPGTFPLAHGLPARVGRLRGYGNAIVPALAQAFIEAYDDVLDAPAGADAAATPDAGTGAGADPGADPAAPGRSGAAPSSTQGEQSDVEEA